MMDTCTSNDFDLLEHIEMVNTDQFCVFKMVSGPSLSSAKAWRKVNAFVKALYHYTIFINGVCGLSLLKQSGAKYQKFGNMIPL